MILSKNYDCDGTVLLYKGTVHDQIGYNLNPLSRKMGSAYIYNKETFHFTVTLKKTDCKSK